MDGAAHTTWVSLGLPPCIRALPDWVTQLAALTTLNLASVRRLTGLPESLGQLAALTILNLELQCQRVDQVCPSHWASWRR
ncbi:MAG UNVERIFIED_CONTAM: hypothetical protein LVR29_14975 [Microcystis novacekii LVE1205-3]|jgi:hypothetical protein